MIKTVVVFGGSNPTPADYAQALQLGQLLGSRGWTVITGGYIGTMEAVSRGAAEQGGHVVGVTCDEIERFRPVGPNPWVQEERRFPTLLGRLQEMITAGDAAIALPGGPGTLTEICLLWNHLLIGALPPRPLILVGAGWREVMQTFFAALGDYIPPPQRRWLSFAENVEQAVHQIEHYKAPLS